MLYIINNNDIDTINNNIEDIPESIDIIVFDISSS